MTYFFVNGRRSQFLVKIIRQMVYYISVVRRMEDDLNYLVKWEKTSFFWSNGRRPQSFRQMEDFINLVRQIKDYLNYLGKWKITSIF